MFVCTRDNRPKRMVAKNWLQGAGTILDWGLRDHYCLSEMDFCFIRDDLQALYADWVVVGNDLRLIMGSQLAINTEENLLFSPEELLATNHEKERQ
jgi:hypothetical protein